MLVREPSHFGSACHAWESSDYRASSPNMGLYKLRSHHPSSTQQRRDPHGGNPNSHCKRLILTPLPTAQPATQPRSPRLVGAEVPHRSIERHEDQAPPLPKGEGPPWGGPVAARTSSGYRPPMLRVHMHVMAVPAITLHMHMYA